MNNSQFSLMRTLVAMFLVAGTCIGGGMLALPVLSGHCGFIPSTAVMFVSCAFMTVTGLLYLEATLWMKDEVHIITLSKRLLGRTGNIVTCLVYLFIGYASLVAYISGGGKQIAFVFSELFSFPLSNFIGYLAFFGLLSLILLLRKQIVENINAFLFTVMVISFVLLIYFCFIGIDAELIGRQNWTHGTLFSLFPLTFTMFSFPGIVQTMIPQLDRNVKALRLAIIGGTSITFLIYWCWNFIVLGSVPLTGAHGLAEALAEDKTAASCLHFAVNNPYISSLAQFFAFFAIATSFLGISLSLIDFITDGFRQKSRPTKVKHLYLVALVALPSLLFTLKFNDIFISALELSGGIGDAIFSGLIPALMIWRGRYFQNRTGPYKVGGGKCLLLIICLFSSTILFYELFSRLNYRHLI